MRREIFRLDEISAHTVPRFNQIGNINYRDLIQQGHIIVTDASGT